MGHGAFLAQARSSTFLERLTTVFTRWRAEDVSSAYFADNLGRDARTVERPPKMMVGRGSCLNGWA